MALAWRRAFYATLGLGLEQQWRAGLYTDTTIAVGERSFKCHRVVLAAISPYFEAMYSSGLLESETGEVKMAEMDADTFESVLKFIYSGDDIVTTENADSVLRAAVMLQIQSLQERCEEFMIENIDLENCMAAWKLASSHHCHDLAEMAWSCVLYHFREISQSEDFLHIDYDDLIAMIKDNDLKTPNEEIVCEAVLRWARADEENRKDKLPELFEHLRLPLVQPEYLLENIDSNRWVQQFPDCKAVVEEAKRYHLLPARRHEFVSSRFIHRNHGDYEDVVLVIGGNLDVGVTTREVLCYRLEAEQWVRLCSLPYDVGVEFALCSYGNAVFVSGGSGHLTGMMYYTVTQNNWIPCQPMLVGRRRHSMVAVGDCLYVLGGYDDDSEQYNTLMSVEKFGVYTGIWENCGYLTYPVRSAAAAVLQNKIFLFGGIDGDDYNMKAVQCFDTRLKTSCHVTDLPSPLSGMCSAVVCSKTVYIFFPSGNVLTMESCGEVKVVGAIPGFDRRGCGVLQHQGDILIFGGIDSSVVFGNVLVFDPRTKVSKTSKYSLDVPRFGFGCAKSTLSKSIFSV